MTRFKLCVMRIIWLCICVYCIPNASASADISHMRIGGTTYSSVYGSMVNGRRLAIASNTYTCNPRSVLLSWEFYDPANTKEGEKIVEGTIVNATFRAGETQVTLPLTTVNLYKMTYAPFTIYTFISDEIDKLKSLDDGDISVSLVGTSLDEYIDTSETFKLTRIEELTASSKTYCLKKSALGMSVIQNGTKISPVHGIITVANEPFTLEFEVDDDKGVHVHIDRDAVFSNKFPSASTLDSAGPFFWGKSAALSAAYLSVGGDSHNSLTGESRVSLHSNGDGTTRLRYKVDRIGKLRLAQPMPQGERLSFYFTYISKAINAAKNHIYGVPAGKAQIIIEEQRDLSEHGCLIDGDTVTLTGTPSLEVFPGRPEYESIEGGDEAWKYWVLTSNKKYNCGYSLSYESGRLTKTDGNYSRFQLANYQLPRKALSTARNKNIRGHDGVITIKGKIMFGHTAHHVTPIVLFDGVLVEEKADDVIVLQESDGSHFLSIDSENQTLSIHQTKEYEWFSTLFNNLKTSQTNDHATVKIGVYDDDMVDVTAHAITYSKLIDGNKAVVIELDEGGFKKFKQVMDMQLSNPSVGYISVYVDHSNKFYSGDFSQ
jgi:hypothetical protein